MNQNKTLDLTVIILTYNEELHLERCIKSILNIASRIIIIDSFSTDKTQIIASQFNVEFYQRLWPNNHSLQFNWALENCAINSTWTMRLDADEFITPLLSNELYSLLYSDNKYEFNGVIIPRKVVFKNKLLRFGGFNKVPLLRIWKSGIGKCENRWMDEHIILQNPNLIKTKNVIIDENLNLIHWWTSKHNNYAKREAFDFLITKYNIIINEDNLNGNFSLMVKRKIKTNYYNSLPLFYRAIGYFIFRYIFRLGFLDGKNGLIWHFLQGLWYRFLVDVNIYEIEKETNKDSELIKTYIKEHQNN